MQRSRLLLLTLVAALAAPTAWSAPSTESKRPASDRVHVAGSDAGRSGEASITSFDVPARQAKKVKAFWTSQRMRAAKPVHATAEAAIFHSSAPPDRGVPWSTEGTPPSGASRTEAVTLFGSSGENEEYYWPLDQYDSAPATTEGKVFFRLPSGIHVCSATVVKSRNRSLVWTAGHCVYDGEKWAKWMMFCPAYLDGNCPYGKWVPRLMYTTSAWFDKENFAYDVGAVVMPRHHGDRIVDVVGAQGIAFNRSRYLYWNAIGYPAAPPFDGERLYVCEDTTRGLYDNPRPGPFQVMIDCTMTPGSSGGGWLIRPDAAGYGYVNSVTSQGIVAAPILLGTYHGTVAQDLYRVAGS